MRDIHRNKGKPAIIFLFGERLTALEELTGLPADKLEKIQPIGFDPNGPLTLEEALTREFLAPPLYEAA